MKFRRNRHSLSVRLVLAQTSIVALAAAVVTVAFYIAGSQRIDGQLQLFATGIAASLMPIAEASPPAAAAFADEIVGYHAQSMRSAFDVKEQPQLLYQLFDAGHELLIRSADAPALPMFPDRTAKDAGPSPTGAVAPSGAGEQAHWSAEIDVDGHVRTANQTARELTARELEEKGLAPPPGARGRPVFELDVGSPSAKFSTGVMQYPSPPAGPGIGRSQPGQATGGARNMRAPLALRTQQSASAASALGPVPIESTWGEPRFENVEIAGKRWRLVRLRDARGNEVQAGIPGDWARKVVLVSLGPLLIQGAWILPLAVLMTWLIGRYTMSPLHRLARLIGARSSTDLSPLRPDVDYSEIAPLVSETNRLLGQLQKLLLVERDAFSNAAHELLTPIAVIQAQAHVLRVADDDHSREQAATHLEEGLQRVSTLIRQLLMLAKAGATAPAAFLQEGDLVPPLQERVAAAASRAIAKNIELDLHCPRTCRYRFDQDTLMAAVDNLVDNAIRYSPSGSHVSIDLVEEEGVVMLVVTDDGPGIPAEHLEHAKQRFFRIPGTLEPGSGLGLAIADCTAQLHGGTLTLESGPNGRGLRACLRLPRRVTEP